MNPELSSTDRFVDRIARSTVLDPLGDIVQPIVQKALNGTGPLAPLNDFLHGKQLGHSLHAVVTDVPVGAWTLAVVFDGLELAGRTGFAPASDFAIGFGMLGGVLAAATGYAEWSDTSGQPKRLGTAHALGNSLAFGAYAASLLLRSAGKRRAGIACALLGYGTASLAAYLGGELSTGLQIGVKHTVTPLFPPDEFTPVLPESELSPNEHKRVDFAGVPVLLSRDAQGAIHAVSAVCTHRGAPLEAGAFADGCVTCPWHGARYALADGVVREGPATFPLARFATRITAGQIELRPQFA